jgi:hypothetical protein
MTLKEVLLYVISIGYRVDIQGNLYKNDRLSRSRKIRKTGYKIFQTKIDGKNIYAYIHRIQAYQKYGDKIFDPNLEVRHFDNNKLNNSHENIILGTHSENMFDVPIKIRMHTTRKGAAKKRRFSYEEAEEIRIEHSKGMSYKKLCAKYNVGKSVISYIVNKKTYNDMNHY